MAVVQMLYLPDQLVISVEDNGIGIQQANSDGTNEGIGIKNVTSRANYIGGRLDISSNKEGTCTNIDIPYD